MSEPKEQRVFLDITRQSAQNSGLFIRNNIDLVESLKTRIWEEYMTIRACDFPGWYEGLSPIEKAAWDMKFDEVQDN